MVWPFHAMSYKSGLIWEEAVGLLDKGTEPTFPVMSKSRLWWFGSTISESIYTCRLASSLETCFEIPASRGWRIGEQKQTPSPAAVGPTSVAVGRTASRGTGHAACLGQTRLGVAWDWDPLR